MTIDTAQARQLGAEIAGHLSQGQLDMAFLVLEPILHSRTPFVKLGEIGKPLGSAAKEQLQPFLDRVASGKTEGGWVVIASALGSMLAGGFDFPFQMSRKYLSAADIWYAADIFGERVPGPALLLDMDLALSHLEAWRIDANRWVQRTVGVAVHFWAKRSRNLHESRAGASKLLQFIEPMFSDQDMDVVKGIGWGLKTLGRYYPETALPWLRAVVAGSQPYRRLVLRKALTYFPDEVKAEFLK